MIGDRIKQRREALGWSQDELANRMGYKSRSTINKIELGVNDVTQRKIKKFSEVLGVSIDYLMDEEPAKEFPAMKGVLPLPPKKRMKKLGAIACGEPIFASEEDVYVVGPENADFCLQAAGDSMTGARIHDGDYVFIKSQDMVNDGEIAAVVIGDEATLKRFYYYPEKNMVVLKAENPAYKDLIYTGEELAEIRVLGKAIAFQGKL